MTLQNVHRIEADIKQKRYVEEPRVTSNDDIAFLVTVTDNGQPVDMAAVTMVVLASTRADRQTVITTGTKQTDGSLLFELGSSETAIAGQVKGVAQLFDAEGDRISSGAFSYQVYRDPTGDGYIPTEKDKTFIEIVLVDGPAIIQEAEVATGEARVATQEALDAAELAQNYVDDEGAIYGVFWPKVADPVMTRTNSSIGKVAAVGVDGEYVRNDFDDAQIFREIGSVTDAYGNEFVRIPKFYIKKADGPGFKSIRISKVQHGGFYLPKCFWDFENETELPYVDVGKYRASLAADNKLESKPDKYPLVSRNIVQFRDYARNNNGVNSKGYQQEDVHVRDVLTTLFHVEFATLHSQSVMSGFSAGEYSASHVAVLTEAQANRFVLAGAHATGFRIGQSIGIGTSRGGNNITDYRTVTAIADVDATNKALVFDGAPLDIVAGHFVYNTAYKTGLSRNIAASSGSPVSNIDGKHPCSYRGIESMWGDIYTFVDGINIDNHQAWVAENADDYASNVFAHPYKKLGYLNSVDNGYPKFMGSDTAHPYAELPREVGAGSTTYYADYYYQATGQRVAIVGGYWNNGSTAGLSYWNAYYSSGYAHLYIGGRLLKKAL